LDPWWYALAALPSLERVRLGLQGMAAWDKTLCSNPLILDAREHLLCVSLNISFYFTDAHCHAIARALERGSSITSINFEPGCSFLVGDGYNRERSEINAPMSRIFGEFISFFNAPLRSFSLISVAEPHCARRNRCQC
jgi:hypothetical protein